MTPEYRLMQPSDLKEAIEFWKGLKGLGITKVDTQKGLGNHLKKNPVHNYVALADGKIIGTVLGGFDGRRTYIYHLAVDKKYRKQDIAKTLMDLIFRSFKKINAEKCHMLVLKDNHGAREFYKKIGCQLREDVVIFTKEL